MPTGKIKLFNHKKGYGFITEDKTETEADDEPKDRSGDYAYNPDDDYVHDFSFRGGDKSRFPLVSEIGEPIHINRAALDIAFKSRSVEDAGLGFFSTPGVAITALQRLGLGPNSSKEEVTLTPPALPLPPAWT